jgi:hypothetical protein
MPRFQNWRPPSLPFSFKSALNREYGTFFAIIATFTVLELLAGLFNSGKLTLDAIWVKLFIFSGVLYLTIRYLKKKTKVLATITGKPSYAGRTPLNCRCSTITENRKLETETYSKMSQIFYLTNVSPAASV